jgi:peptide/nickel transport system permease protein
MRLLPGDPLRLFMTQNEVQDLSPEQMDFLKHKFGLDVSVPQQYIKWLGGIFTGNFGLSIYYGEQVSGIIAKCLPVTGYLGVVALIISSIFGILFGVVCALKRGKFIDTLLTLLANWGITMPTFWLGILLIYLFSLKLHWLPTSGFTSPLQDFWLSTRQIILPVICLTTFPLAAIARQTRSAMLEVVQQDYIRTAWAKGLRENVIIIRHVIKNGLIPVITTLGFMIAHIFAGSVLIETIFNISGVGRLMVQSVFQQDYQIVQAVVFIIAVSVVLANLIVDISYSWLDPRIRYN